MFFIGKFIINKLRNHKEIIIKEDARAKTFVSSIILRKEERKCKKKFYQN